MNIRISDKATGRILGSISDQDFEILAGHMEEESSTDRDYFVEQMSIDALERLGASEQFISILRSAVGSSDGIDIVWDSN